MKTNYTQKRIYNICRENTIQSMQMNKHRRISITISFVFHNEILQVRHSDRSRKFSMVSPKHIDNSLHLNLVSEST